MADDGFRTIRLREDFLADIEAFTKTQIARKQNVTSVAEFIYRACAPALSEIAKEYGIFNRKRLKGKYVLEPLPGEG